VATILAIRAGLKDAREGRPAFLWAAITNPAYRPQLLQHGWKDVGRVFALSVVLDAIYQLIVHRGAYALELLIVATTLAVVPYVLVLGTVNRIRRWLARGQRMGNESIRPESENQALQGEQHGKA
jgi:hypothetical protein